MTMKIKETALYTLDELNDKAQKRAYNEWLDEYRESYDWTCDVVYSDAVHYGDKALASVGIDAEWDSWDNCFPGNYADPDSGRYLPYITAADYLPDNAPEAAEDDARAAMRAKFGRRGPAMIEHLEDVTECI